MQVVWLQFNWEWSCKFSKIGGRLLLFYNRLFSFTAVGADLQIFNFTGWAMFNPPARASVMRFRTFRNRPKLFILKEKRSEKTSQQYCVCKMVQHYSYTFRLHNSINIKKLTRIPRASEFSNVEFANLLSNRYLQACIGIFETLSL